jgi:hypothetical protein
MPQAMPIQDFTKEAYEQNIFMQDIYRQLETGEESIKKGDIMDGFESLAAIKERYGI